MLAAVSHHLDILMFATACGLILIGYPVAFTLAGTAILYAGIGQAAGVFDPAFLTALPQRVYGVMTSVVLLAVPLFVFMGVMLERSGVAEALIETMGRLFGRLPGGLGYSVTIVGALLAASTGVVGATVVTMGLLALPTMLRWGYDPKLATGTIAAAGTLGQIIPPSIVLVVLGDVIANAYQKAQSDQGIFAPDSVTVSDLFAGALIPGLLLAGLYLIYQGAVAFLQPARSPAAPEILGRVRTTEILGVLLPPIALILCVLGSILAGIATPTEAAAVGAVGTLLLAGVRQAPRWRPLFIAAWLALGTVIGLTVAFDIRVGRIAQTGTEASALWAAVAAVGVLAVGIVAGIIATVRGAVLAPAVRSTADITAMVFAIVIGATVFSLVFRGLGGEDKVTAFLSDLPGGTMGAVFAVMAAMFLLGFFVDFLEICYIVVPIAAPVLLKMPMPDGTPMSPIWLAVLMAVNLQTSFLHPPFGVALFYLRGVAPPEVRTSDLYRGIVPFVAIQLLCLVVLWFWPGLATGLPAALLGS